MVRKNLPLLSSFLRFDRKCSELGPPLITKTGSAPRNLHFSSVIFDQQLKITFRKSSGPPEKTTPLFLLTPPPKNSKSTCPPLFANIENISGPPAERRDDTVNILAKY